MAYKPKTNHDRIVHRLQIASGMMQKVLEMAKTHHYCIDIIHQSQAAQKALGEANHLILENHLKTCVAKAIRQGKDKQAITEVMEVLNRS